MASRRASAAFMLYLSCAFLTAQSDAFMSSSPKVLQRFSIPQQSGHAATLPSCPSKIAFSPLALKTRRSNPFLLSNLRASSASPSSEPPKPLDKYKIEPVGTNLPTLDSPKVAFPALTAERFRHPLDTRATRVLQRLFPFEFLLRQGLGTVVEQAMFLDNLSTAVRVGPNQLPKIYNRCACYCSTAATDAVTGPLPPDSSPCRPTGG